MTPTSANDRINIRYTRRKNQQNEQSVELPLKLLTIGNFQGNASREADTPLDERQPCAIDPASFDQVMAAQQSTLALTVPNHLQSNIQDLKLQLCFKSLADFHPDALIEQTAELKYLATFRDLLTKLRQSPQQATKYLAAIQHHLSQPPSSTKKDLL